MLRQLTAPAIFFAVFISCVALSRQAAHDRYLAARAEHVATCVEATAYSARRCRAYFDEQQQEGDQEVSALEYYR